jgi:hypothetical protein
MMPKLVSLLDAKPFRFSEDKAYREPTWTTDKTLYGGSQWAVTEYGIENLSGPYHYHIPKSDLRMRMGHAGTWVDHMAEKNWVDVDDFRDIYNRALEIHEAAE